MYPNLLNCEHIYQHESDYEDERGWFCEIRDEPCPLASDEHARWCCASCETDIIDASEACNGELRHLLQAGDGTIYEAEGDMLPWNREKSWQDNIIAYYEQGLKEIAAENHETIEKLNRHYRDLLKARNEIRELERELERVRAKIPEPQDKPQDKPANVPC